MILSQAFILPSSATRSKSFDPAARAEKDIKLIFSVRSFFANRA